MPVLFNSASLACAGRRSPVPVWQVRNNHAVRCLPGRVMLPTRASLGLRTIYLGAVLRGIVKITAAHRGGAIRLQEHELHPPKARASLGWGVKSSNTMTCGASSFSSLQFYQSAVASFISSPGSPLGGKRRNGWKHIGIPSSHSPRTDCHKVHVQDGSRVTTLQSWGGGTMGLQRFIIPTGG